MKGITIHQQWQEFIEKAQEWLEYVDLRNGEDVLSLSRRDVEILSRLAFRADQKQDEMMKVAKGGKKQKCLAIHPALTATVCMEEKGHKEEHKSLGGYKWKREK
jgi:hypothetical protein